MARIDLSCPACGGGDLQQEKTPYEGRFEGRKPMLVSRPVTLMLCVSCRYILHFYGEPSDFG